MEKVGSFRCPGCKQLYDIPPAIPQVIVSHLFVKHGIRMTAEEVLERTEGVTAHP